MLNTSDIRLDSGGDDQNFLKLSDTPLANNNELNFPEHMQELEKIEKVS